MAEPIENVSVAAVNAEPEEPSPFRRCGARRWFGRATTLDRARWTTASDLTESRVILTNCSSSEEVDADDDDDEPPPPYYPSDQQPPSYSSFESQWDDEPIDFLNASLGTTSGFGTCPDCRRIVTSIPITYVGKTSWLICMGLTMMGCFPCMWMPFCMNVFKDTYHFCSQCGTLIYVRTSFQD